MKVFDFDMLAWKLRLTQVSVLRINPIEPEANQRTFCEDPVFENKQVAKKGKKHFLDHKKDKLQ